MTPRPQSPSDAECDAIREQVIGTSDICATNRLDHNELIRTGYALGYAAARASAQEPVAWRTFDGEGGYDYRDFDGNENYRAEFRARNPAPTYWDWVEPLYTAPPAAPVVEPPAQDAKSRIAAYLTGGGLFNPDLADHDAVRDLLIDCRDRLAALTAELVRVKDERDEAWASAQAYKLDLAHVRLNEPCGPIGYATWEEYRKANPAREDWYAAKATHSEGHINQLSARAESAERQLAQAVRVVEAARELVAAHDEPCPAHDDDDDVWQQWQIDNSDRFSRAWAAARAVLQAAEGEG
jgi:hypothetical protein